MSAEDDEIVVESTRLLLEPILPEHAACLFPVLLDPKIYTYLPHDPPLDVEHLEGKYRRWQTRRSPDGQERWLNWAVFSKGSQFYIGTMQATVYSDCVSALAYELGSEFWGYGYATEACSAIIPILFSTYGVQTIKAEVDTRNVSSQKLLNRLGFSQSGLKKNADFFKGQASDEYIYKLTSKEWEIS